MPSINQPEAMVTPMNGAQHGGDRPTLREAFSEGLKADLRRDLEKLDNRAGGVLVEARAAAHQAREREANKLQLGERIAAALTGANDQGGVLLERKLRTNMADDAVKTLQAIRASVREGLKAVDQKAPTVGERLAFPTLLSAEINAQRSAAGQAQRPPGLFGPTIKALQHRFEPKEVARREAEKIASPRFGEDEQQRRARIGAFLHGIAAYQIKSPVHSALGAHLVANLDGTPVPPRKSLTERATMAAWSAAKGLAADANRTLRPAAWEAARTSAILAPVQGESQAARFQRLGEAAQDYTYNMPDRLDSLGRRVGESIRDALKVETKDHILTKEAVLGLADQLDLDLDAAWKAGAPTQPLEDAYEQKLENHVAAAVAMWGYDPVNVESVLHQREHEAAAQEWKSMTPVERQSVCQAYDRDIGLTEHDLRFATFTHTYHGEGARAFDREWAAGLNDSQRSKAIVSTADSIKHEGEKARRGEGWDADQHAALRSQLALLAEGRMSDRDLKALKDEQVTLMAKALDGLEGKAGLTAAEEATLDELTRRVTTADLANMALYGVGHGLDLANDKLHLAEREQLGQIVENGQRIKLVEGSAEYDRAWAGLQEYVVARGMGDGTDFGQPSQSLEYWQHTGSYELDGDTAHQFRHRDHPYTGQREYATVRDGEVRALAEDRAAKLEAANSH